MQWRDASIASYSIDRNPTHLLCQVSLEHAFAHGELTMNSGQDGK